MIIDPHAVCGGDGGVAWQRRASIRLMDYLVPVEQVRHRLAESDVAEQGLLRRIRINVPVPKEVDAASIHRASCVPADPETKGGSEATVKIAKGDLLPLATNLRDEYDAFMELEEACEAWEEKVNNRVHRVTRRKPAAMLNEERARLHTIPQAVFVQAVGEERVVTKDSLVLHQHARYSVPHELAQQQARVLVREHGSDVIITHASEDGLREVARHEKAPPGSWRIDEAHYPPAPAGPLERRVRPSTSLETAFLGIGPGAEAWLLTAAETGVTRIQAKMQHAVDLADYHGSNSVAAALEAAAQVGRYEQDDLISILAHQATARSGRHTSTINTPSLQAGTRSWDGFGQ